MSIYIYMYVYIYIYIYIFVLYRYMYICLYMGARAFRSLVFLMLCVYRNSPYEDAHLIV